MCPSSAVTSPRSLTQSRFVVCLCSTNEAWSSLSAEYGGLGGFVTQKSSRSAIALRIWGAASRSAACAHGVRRGESDLGNSALVVMYSHHERIRVRHEGVDDARLRLVAG